MRVSTLTLPSYAKVNLCLHVTGRRPDGYHALLMIMQRISLCDEITLALTSAQSGIVIECDHPDVPLGEENIGWRAARDYLQTVRIASGIRIGIRKRIPMGGGLGGGSSNAATVLLGLNDLFGRPLETVELMKIGLRLGADVPFFVLNRPAAFAGGIGEILTPVDDLPEIWFVLINPGISVPTALIYRSLSLGLTNQEKNLTISRFDRSLEGIASLLYNDLERVAFEKYPEVAEVKRYFLENGAAAALMSGSGATVFGLFKNREGAEGFLSERGNDIVSRGWRHYLCRSL